MAVSCVQYDHGTEHQDQVLGETPKGDIKQTTERRGSPRADYFAAALVWVGNHQFSCDIANLSGPGVMLFPPERHGRGTFLRINIKLPALDQVLDVDGFVVREGQKDGFYCWGVKFHQPSKKAEVLLRTYVQWRRKPRPVQGQQAAADLGTVSQSVAPQVTLLAAEESAAPRTPSSPAPPPSASKPATNKTPAKPASPPAAKSLPPPAARPAPHVSSEQQPQARAAPLKPAGRTPQKPVAAAEQGKANGKPPTITSQYRAVLEQRRREADQRWHERQEKEESKRKLRKLYEDALKNL